MKKRMFISKFFALAVVIMLVSSGFTACKDDLTKTANKNPKADDYDISGLEQTFDGSPKSVTIEPKKGKSPGTVTILYNKSRTVPSDIGNYAVTFNVAAARGWNAASGLRAGTLVISADGNLTPTAEDYNISGLTHVYDGSPKSVTIEPKEYKSSGAITASYNGSPDNPSAAGQYNVTFDVAAANGWNAASDLFAGILIINPYIPGTQTPTEGDYNISGLSQNYDGSPKSITITPKDGKSTGARTILYNGNNAAPSAAGTYTVTFSVAAVPGWYAANGLSAGTLTIASNASSRVKYKIYSDGTLTEGYTITNWANADAFQLATTSGGGHSGTRAMRLPDNGQWTPPGRGLTIRAGSAANIDWSTVNALSFWVKGGSNLTANSFGLLDDQGSGQDPLNVEYKGENGQGTAITTNWQNILIPLPAGTAKSAAISKTEVFKTWIQGNDQNGKAVYIDDIELVSVTKTLTSITIPSTASNLATGTVSIASLLGNYKAQYTVDGKQLSLINKTAPNDDNGTVTFANWFNVAYNAGGGATVSGDNLTVTGNFTLTVSFDGKTSNTLTGTIVQGGGGNQTPVVGDYNIGTLTYAYDGNAKPVTITANAGKSSGAVSVRYNGSATVPSAVGTYAVTFNVAAATGWNAVNGLSAGTLNITGETPVAGDYTYSGLSQTADGSAKSVTITPNANKSTGARTIYYNGSATAPSAQGSYTVTFDVAAAAGWNAASGLSAGTLTIAANTSSNIKYKIYSDGTLTSGYTITNWANAGAFQQSTTSGGGHTGTRAMRLPDTGETWGRGLSIRANSTSTVNWSTVDALSFWVKGADNVRISSFGFLDDQGSGGDSLNVEYKGESEQGVTLSNTWTNYIIPLPAANAKGTAISRSEVFKIWIVGDQNGKAVYIDDIELITATKDHAITIPSSTTITAGTVAISSLVGNYKTTYTVGGKTVSLFNNTTKFTNWFNITYNVSGATRNGDNITATGNFTLSLTFGNKTSNQLSATVSASPVYDNIKQVANGIEIKWNAVSQAASYVISRAGSRLGTYTQLGTSTTTTYVDTNPNSNKYENYYRVQARNSSGTNVGTAQLISLELSMFGENMKFYDIKYDTASAIRTEINNLHDNETWHGHWINNRYGMYFKPGTYQLGGSLKIGFYTHAAGLGKVPTETKLYGGIETPPHLSNNNSTQNFWRAVENFEVASGTFGWYVSQAAPARRIKSSVAAVFNLDQGYASGGYTGDCSFSTSVGSGTQQQWYARNCHFTQAFWGVNWNKTIQGSSGNVEASTNNATRTKIDQTPVIREKPFLYMENGEYKIFVPALKTNAVGVSWTDTNIGSGTSLDLVQNFYIAKPGDTAATINAALTSGKHIFFTPGRYELSAPIRITRAGTIVLGTGLATLIPSQANTYGALFIDDVDNVTVAGLMFDALYNSTYLICAGGSNASNSHSTAPTLLSDIFLRVGGVRNNCNVDIAALINSNNVIGDHFWVWRADHGGGGGNTGWTNNTSKNGVIVKGNDVTFYGLFVEHFQEYETLWLGENGRTYFYQNEKPYDPTSQSVYMSRGTVQGWAAYKVANTVNNHYAVGMGVYAVFSRAVSVQNAIEVPNKSGVRIENVCTLHLTNAGGYIRSIVNGAGQSTEGGYISERRYLRSYSNGTAVVGSGPTTGTQPANETFTIPTNLVP